MRFRKLIVALATLGMLTSYGPTAATALTATQGITVKSIVSNGSGTCALSTQGRVWCWGTDRYGVLGLGNPKSGFGNLYSNHPIQITGIINAIQIDKGDDFACALLKTGTVKCWGEGISGQLGTGNRNSSAEPVDVKGLTGVVQVTTGSKFACALLTNKQVKCWGANTQMGSGTLLGTGKGDMYITVPTTVRGVTDAAQIDAGESRTCAVLTTGSVKCWGYGKRGDGATYVTNIPNLVTGVTNAKSVEVGRSAACLTLTTGKVSCWGSDFDSSIPVLVPSLENVSSMKFSPYRYCAVLTDSQVKCWGSELFGELGNGGSPKDEIETPTVISQLSGTRELSVELYRGCALFSPAQIKCWGHNYIGDGITDSSTTPLPVTLRNAPAYATGVKVISSSAGKSLVTWKPADSNGTSGLKYRVRIRSNSASQWGNWGTATSGLKAYVAKLSKGKSYQLQVAASTKYGLSLSSIVTFKQTK